MRFLERNFDYHSECNGKSLEGFSLGYYVIRLMLLNMFPGVSIGKQE